MSEHKNILPTNQHTVNEDVLKYVENTLTEEQRHNLEMELLENEFMNDAIEGLEQFSDKQKISSVVHDLNYKLIKQTTKYKVRKHKRKISEQQLIIVSIIIILVLCVLGYWFIKKLET